MQFDDQGLVNTDPRFIAVPDGFINLIMTDVHGITFNLSPKMVSRRLSRLYTLSTRTVLNSRTTIHAR